MFNTIDPPTQKITIINQILKFLMIICILQTFFLALSHQWNALSYFISALTYVISWRRLSYFGCIINQIFNLALIWNLLLGMANQLQNGIYDLSLSAEQIYKMSSLIFNIICIYFNFTAYQAFKQLAYEIHQYQKSESDNQEKSMKRQINF